MHTYLGMHIETILKLYIFNFKKGGFNMKSLFKVLLLFAISFMLCTICAFAQNDTFYITDNTVTLIGYADSEGKRVTIDVYNPGYDYTDIYTAQNYLEVLLFRNQTETISDGSFTFEFDVEKDGIYNAFVYVEGEDDLRNYSIYYVDGEVLNTDFNDYITNTVPNDWTGIARGNCEAVSGKDGTGLNFAQTTRLYKEFGTTFSGGAYLFEFDLYAGDLLNRLYIRLFNQDCIDSADNDNLFECFTLEPDGKIGFFDNTDGWSVSDNSIAYEPDKWYNIKVWIDLDNKMATYYVDDILLGETVTSEKMLGIKGFSVVAEKNTNSALIIDNFKVLEINPIIANSYYNSGEGIPERLLDLVKINLSTQKTGNIFYNEDTIKFDVDFESFIYDDTVFSINYKITDVKTGDVLWTKNEQTILSFQNEFLISIMPDFRRYGIFNFTLEASYSDKTFIKETQFSFVNNTNSQNDNEDVGVVVHGYHQRGDVDLFMDALDNAGFSITRTDFGWEEYEKEEGVYAFSDRMKKFVSRCEEDNIDCIALIHTNNSLYGSTNALNLDLSDEYLLHFKEYLQHLATHEAASTKYFEIINEPDWTTSYQDAIMPTAQNFEKYVRILKCAYDALKEVRPDAMILAPCTAHANLEWIEGLFKAGGGEYIDIVSLHPYWNWGVPEDGTLVTMGTGKSYYFSSWSDSLERVRDLMDKYNVDAQLWATEMGTYTGNGGRDIYEQANFYVRHSVINESEKLLDRMLFYDLQEDGTDPDNPNHNYGMLKTWTNQVDVPYAAKPVYPAMVNYNNMIYDKEFVTLETTRDSMFGPTTYSYKFKSDYETMYVLWNKDLETTAVKTFSGNDERIKEAYVYDIYGNKSVYPVENGTLSINVTDEPKYVVFKNITAKLYSGGSEVTSLLDIDTDDTLTAEFVNTFNLESDFNAFAALYENKHLVGLYPIKNDGSAENEFKMGNADEIKILVWDKILAPVMESYIIK